MNELEQQLINFKHKMNMHLMERNSNNLNEQYMEWLEQNINNIKELIAKMKKVA